MIQTENSGAFSSSKVISLADASRIIREARAVGKTVGLCHGGFDLLHPGHLKHFESAKQQCDLLVVSVTSDRFVSPRKGTGRPIFPEQLRAYSIACLAFVDYVVITDFARAVEVIALLQPTYYIKGPDFVGKTTPGITAEREAIERAGGKMLYTMDPKLSTTEIIDYIRTLEQPEILLVLDRDGTLIRHQEFLGKEEHWREQVFLREEVADYVAHLQTKHRTTTIVVSNQGGVARRLFPEQRVQEVNSFIDGLLRQKNIAIHSWKYSPHADARFVQQHPEISFDPNYVQEITTRKPHPALVHEALLELGKTIAQFQTIVVLGDRQEDEGLARDINAKFIDVKGKTLEEMKKEFS